MRIVTTRCPSCGYKDSAYICRMCKTDKRPPIAQPAPAEAVCYDVFEEIERATREFYPRTS